MKQKKGEGKLETRRPRIRKGRRKNRKKGQGIIRKWQEKNQKKKSKKLEKKGGRIKIGRGKNQKGRRRIRRVTGED